MQFKVNDKIILKSDKREGKIYSASHIEGFYSVVWLLDNGEYSKHISTLKENEIELKSE